MTLRPRIWLLSMRKSALFVLTAAKSPAPRLRAAIWIGLLKFSSSPLWTATVSINSYNFFESSEGGISRENLALSLISLGMFLR
jgi:hypothetical protein